MFLIFLQVCLSMFIFVCFVSQGIVRDVQLHMCEILLLKFIL